MFINIKKDVENMLQIILKIIGVLIILAGVILIYDSRLITKKFFGFGDQNEATIGMKLIGFIIAIIGAIVIFAVNRL
jgi:hypothetical protein